MLADNDEKVVNVAISNGFDSHDGFTRAFSRQFGITPQKYYLCLLPVFSKKLISGSFF
ncbi:MAG: hypothetical protein GX757_09110 [Clostridiales bacterium]|nr:hypothetical protein [Clostridiales bacterium]